MPRVFNSTSDGKAVLPFSYTLDYINLINHAGKTVDISALVTDFSISESIYRHSLEVTINVKDAVNMFEELSLSGQERIEISLSRQQFEKTEKAVILTKFIVTEYPVFAKMPNKLQVYSIRGISEFAFISSLSKISRAMSGNALSLIKNILDKDLSVPVDDITISKQSSRNISLIIPNLTPLEAIQLILRRSFDSSGLPFFMYETLGNKIKIVSQSELVSEDNKAIRTYSNTLFFDQDPKTTEDFDQRQSRIIDMSSDLRMSKYIAGQQGAFAGKIFELDLGTKTLVVEKFDYSQEFKKNLVCADKPVLSDKFLVNKKKLNQLSDSANYFCSTNSLDSVQTYSESVKSANLAKARSYTENLDTIIHDLNVAGDLNIRSGQIIDLKLLKSVDDRLELKNSETSGGDKSLDKFLSGRYLITSVVHKFSESYSMDIRVKRDSFSA